MNRSIYSNIVPSVQLVDVYTYILKIYQLLITPCRDTRE